MICIYCLREQDAESLTDEHVIPKGLGGWLSLGSAACARCNNTVVNPLDHFLTTKFPPTSLARTDLGVKSHSGAMPKTVLVGHDDVVGQFEVRIEPGGGAKIRPMVKRRGDSLFVVAHSVEEAFQLLAKKTKRKLEELTPIASGVIVSPPEYQFKDRVDWTTASKAVAKIFYCYLLLELGEEVLPSSPAQVLRDYFMRGILPTVPVDSGIGRSIPFASGGTLEVPPHHHVLVFDSADARHNWVCLFGLFWFSFPYELTAFLPHGRMIAFHPQQRYLAEAVTKAQGVWRFRTSIKFGWQRPGTTAPEIPQA